MIQSVEEFLHPQFHTLQDYQDYQNNISLLFQISSGTLNQLVWEGYGMNQSYIFSFVILATGIYANNTLHADT